jgi:hypothetical protein
MAGVLALAMVVSGWMVASVVGQSSQQAPYFREVNSELMHELLETIAGGSSNSTMETLLSNILEAMAEVGSHDDPAIATGDLVHGECDDTSTDAVDEGDQAKIRVDCTTRALIVSERPHSIHYRTSAGATEDEFEVKATAGVLTGGIVTNTAATVSYLKCFNLTAANTTPASSTVFFAAAIPGQSIGAGFALPIPAGGVTFSVALTCILVKGAADTDVAEVGANEVKVNLFYR